MPVERVSRPAPPEGLLRWAFQVPRILYRLGLGWILGDRFLMIRHHGRHSGRLYETVVEVIGREDAPEAFLVVSAWGEAADWYRNLKVDPQAWIVVGRRECRGTMERLEPPDAGQALLNYGRRHPGTLLRLARFMGYRMEKTEEDFRALGERLVVVRLRPMGIGGKILP